MDKILHIGLGGLYYHGVTLEGVVTHPLDVDEILLVDPDKVEERNAGRQWIVHPDWGPTSKVARAADLWESLGVPESRCYGCEELYRPGGLRELVGGLDFSVDPPGIMMVVVLPDAHSVRVGVWDDMKELVPEYDLWRWLYLTAGNELTEGWAFGTWWGSDGVPAWDLMKAYPDIRREAGKQVVLLCGELDSGEADIPQSPWSNHLTAGRLWGLAARLLQGWRGGEAHWMQIPHADGNPAHIRAWARERGNHGTSAEDTESTREG